MTNIQRIVSDEHPTRQRLIDTTMVLLGTTPMSRLSSEVVLESASVSKGSLYHFFKDFSDLVETAAVNRFSIYVAKTLEALTTAVATSDDPQVVRPAFKEIAQRQQAANSTTLRFERLHLAHAAISNERMRLKLSFEVDRLTNEWCQIYIICREKGWAKEGLDPRAVAVLLQSTIIGRVIDDISSQQMDPASWVQVLQFLLDSIFFYHVPIVEI